MRASTREGWRSSPLSWPRTRARSRYLKTPRYVPDGLSASDWAARQQKEKAAKVQNKAKYPKGAPQVRSPAFRFVLLFASRRRSTPPVRRRGDGVERTPSRGTPSPRWRRRGSSSTPLAPCRAPSSRGRAQVLGVKEYLEKLQAKQTFYKNTVGNAKVAKSGHVYACVEIKQ